MTGTFSVVPNFASTPSDDAFRRRFRFQVWGLGFRVSGLGFRV